MNKEKLIEYYVAHKGEIIGVGIALLFALSVLILGMLKVLFIGICIFVGYHIGKELSEDKDYLKKIMAKIKHFLKI